MESQGEKKINKRKETKSPFCGVISTDPAENLEKDWTQN